MSSAWTFENVTAEQAFMTDSPTSFRLTCPEAGCRLSFMWSLDAEVLAHLPYLPQEIAAKLMGQHSGSHS